MDAIAQHIGSTRCAPLFVSSVSEVLSVDMLSARMPVEAEPDKVFSLHCAPTSRQHSGWLLKRKSSESRSRLFNGTNRRFFTLDFSTQQFYYSNSDSSKTVSDPTPFRDLSGVHLLCRMSFADQEVASAEDAAIHEDAATLQLKRTNSKGSLTSGIRIPRISSFSTLAKRPPEQHGFTVHTASKALELICPSKEEAERWVAAFREAIAMGAACFPSPSPSPATEYPGSPSFCSEVARCPSPPSSTTIGSASESASLSSLSEQGCASCEEQEAPAPQPAPLPEKQSRRRRAFGLLPARAQVFKKKASPAVEPQPVDVPGPAPILSMDAASDDVGDAWLPVDGHLQRVCHKEHESPSMTPNASRAGDLKEPARYADQSRGLTLQQRLAAMEFSDDEDEDDEQPRRTAKPRSANPSAPTSDLCTPFKEPDSDDDDDDERVA